jgi:hypothetical protein
MICAIDGNCHNSEPGTFGHECGKPAVGLGTAPDGFASGFCDECRARGWEARGKTFRRLADAPVIFGKLAPHPSVRPDHAQWCVMQGDSVLLTIGHTYKGESGAREYLARFYSGLQVDAAGQVWGRGVAP